jgi:hypothetical protein
VSADTRRTSVVAGTSDRTLAHIWRTALEEEGIHAFVAGESIGGLFAGIPQVANVTVVVFEEDLERARRLLADEDAPR